MRYIDEETRDNILTITRMAESARTDYASSDDKNSSCMTIRVPVALLNRIRELAEDNNIKVPE